MIQFILNDTLIKTNDKEGSTLLDFVRYRQNLVGTKIGCREGDCGACTLLMGEIIDGKLCYKSLTSCITPLGNAHGKHIVSIEGLNMEELTPFQQAMVDHSGQQCGFCTVGFIVSFAGECLSRNKPSLKQTISAIDGNICRCTGYKSIERAAQTITHDLAGKDLTDPIPWLVKNKYIPDYFNTIKNRLEDISSPIKQSGSRVIGGGTDLLVQQHDKIYEEELYLVSGQKELVEIVEEGDYILIGGASNTTQLLQSEILNRIFPELWKHLKLVSSTPIRNIATLAGNIINASPIGDLTAFFLALDSDIELVDMQNIKRTIQLKNLFLGYKQLDKSSEEIVSYIKFKKPDPHTHFNFEKVSKRKYLDIASVNTAISIRVINGIIEKVNLSAGGVGPTPKHLSESCDFMKSKPLTPATLIEAAKIIADEISPISDARGTKEYKSLLLRQLFFAHFITLFPDQFSLKSLR